MLYFSIFMFINNIPLISFLFFYSSLLIVFGFHHSILKDVKVYMQPKLNKLNIYFIEGIH